MAIDYAAILSNALLVEDVIPWEGSELDALREGCPMALYGALLAGVPCVFATPSRSMPPREVVKAMRELTNRTDILCVCSLLPGAEGMTRLLHENGFAFVTAEGEAFVPGLLKLAAMPAAEPPKEGMAPAERLAFLWLCQRPWCDSYAQTFSDVTGIPRSTAQRVMNKLKARVPMSVRVGGKTGRALVYHVEDPYTFTKEGVALLGSVPAGRLTVSADEVADLPLAGESALARCSGLPAPATEVRACSRKRARSLKRAPRGADPSSSCQVLMLPYDPEALASKGVVDLATMALTCDGSSPVVAAALAEALEEAPWLLSLAYPYRSGEQDTTLVTAGRPSRLRATWAVDKRRSF